MKLVTLLHIATAVSAFAGEQIPLFLSREEREEYVSLGRKAVEPIIIDQTDFLNLVKGGKVVLLDTRESADFDNAHVRNSTSIPFSQITRKRVYELIPNLGDTVLVYTPDNFRAEASGLPPQAKGKPSWIYQIAITLEVYGYKDVRGIDPRVHFRSIPQLLVFKDKNRQARP
jgi:hypothetical protein